jgi:hypothetical protein
MKRIAVMLTALIVAANAYAGVATTAMDILKVPSGIKSQAMGGAYLAVADNLEAIDINPAGLAAIERQDIMLIHNMYLSDVFFDSVYYAMAIEGAGTLGFAAKFLSAGTVPESLENPDGTYAGGTGKDIGGIDYLAAISYGTNLSRLAYSDFSKNLNIGLSLKVTGEMLGSDYSNIGISVDIGAVYTIKLEEEDFLSNRGQMLWNKIGLGLVLKNLGTSLGAGLTPMTIAAGAYTQFLNVGTTGNRIRVAADADYSIDTGISISGGLEYMHNIGNFSLALRTGYDYNGAQKLSAGFAIGGGVGLKTGTTGYSLDYVFMPYSEFGSGHKIGLYIKF